MIKDFRKESRIGWGREVSPEENLSNSELQLGAVLRIADAMEQIAKNYDQLIRDKEWLKKMYNEAGERLIKKDRQIAGLKGHIKRLKKIT